MWCGVRRNGASGNPRLPNATFWWMRCWGPGARGAVEGLLRDAIESVNGRESRCPVVAVDIPSGLHADSGEVQGAAVEADYTVTFTAPKVGMFQGEAQRYLGELVVRDIGSPAELIEEVGHGNLRWSEPGEFGQFAKRRKADGNKGDYGHALIVAGSVGKSGAAVLASWSALRTGAGLVTVATPEPVLPIVAAHTPEIMTEPLVATESGKRFAAEFGIWKVRRDIEREARAGDGAGTYYAGRDAAIYSQDCGQTELYSAGSGCGWAECVCGTRGRTEKCRRG